MFERLKSLMAPFILMPNQSTAYVFYQSDPTEALRQMEVGIYVDGVWKVFGKGADYLLKTKPVDDKTLLKFGGFDGHLGTGTIVKKYAGPSTEKLLAFVHVWSPDGTFYEEAIQKLLKKSTVREISYPFLGYKHDGLMGEITIPPEANGKLPEEMSERYSIVEEFEGVFWDMGKAIPTSFLVERELEV